MPCIYAKNYVALPISLCMSVQCTARVVVNRTHIYIYTRLAVQYVNRYPLIKEESLIRSFSNFALTVPSHTYFSSLFHFNVAHASVLYLKHMWRLMCKETQTLRSSVWQSKYFYCLSHLCTNILNYVTYQQNIQLCL